MHLQEVWIGFRRFGRSVFTARNNKRLLELYHIHPSIRAVLDVWMLLSDLEHTANMKHSHPTTG